MHLLLQHVVTSRASKSLQHLYEVYWSTSFFYTSLAQFVQKTTRWQCAIRKLSHSKRLRFSFPSMPDIFLFLVQSPIQISICLRTGRSLCSLALLPFSCFLSSFLRSLSQHQEAETSEEMITLQVVRFFFYISQYTGTKVR